MLQITLNQPIYRDRMWHDSKSEEKCQKNIAALEFLQTSLGSLTLSGPCENSAQDVQLLAGATILADLDLKYFAHFVEERTSLGPSPNFHLHNANLLKRWDRLENSVRSTLKQSESEGFGGKEDGIGCGEPETSDWEGT
ncbi:hypothetical protein BDV40DRAFT_301797 [Aspergillus tamarii]|uniref:Uncharacterized protein n=1 Tax=Aspergillus tamarii TaxID=41984 RepID=A0A5N6UQR7_ASPTM|nr:hypothetical protein BDV40DRAFT_301797 [Aspergillus tamarii]